MKEDSITTQQLKILEQLVDMNSRMKGGLSWAEAPFVLLFVLYSMKTDWDNYSLLTKIGITSLFLAPFLHCFLGLFGF